MSGQSPSVRALLIAARLNQALDEMLAEAATSPEGPLDDEAAYIMFLALIARTDGLSLRRFLGAS